MSLQKCPNCKKINDFWYIYWDLNTHRFHKKIECQFCEKKMDFSFQKRSFGESIVQGFLWMLPSFILIYLVATLKMNYITAIALVILYHFTAFYAIIKLGKYKK